jgi:hypothetical protein
MWRAGFLSVVAGTVLAVKQLPSYHTVLYSMLDESRLQSALIRHTVLYCTESDDTRCCDNTICPPEDGHVNARNISRIVMQHTYC